MLRAGAVSLMIAGCFAPQPAALLGECALRFQVGLRMRSGTARYHWVMVLTRP